MPPSAARCDLPIALFESTNRTPVKKKVPDTFFSLVLSRIAGGVRPARRLTGIAVGRSAYDVGRGWRRTRSNVLLPPIDGIFVSTLEPSIFQTATVLSVDRRNVIALPQ